MTRREQLRRAETIRQQTRTVRDQLNVALTDMDYERALALQVEIDDLKQEWLCLMRLSNAHHRYYSRRTRLYDLPARFPY